MPDELTRIPRKGAHLVIEGEDIPFGAYQAIYHQLTRKTEKRTQKYKEAYDIRFEDLRNLHVALRQSTQQYNVRSSRCQIIHQFRDDTASEYSDFDKFKIADCSTRSCTKRIEYEYDFLIILPAEVPEAEDIAQRTTVKLVLDQVFPEDFRIEGQFFFFDISEAMNVTATIEFSDFSVSRAIFATIDHWAASLPTRKDSSVILALRKAEPMIRYYFDDIVRFVTLIVGANAALKSSSIGEAAYLILAATAVSFMLASFARFLVGKFYNYLDDLKHRTALLFSEGDKTRGLKLENKRARRRALLFLVTVGLALNVAAGILSTVFYEYLKT